jgi:hypothetical protein
MNIERINQLFQGGYITAEEHNLLIQQKVGSPKKKFTYSLLTFIVGLAGNLLMLVFTKNGTQFALLSDGKHRLWAGAICSVLGIFTFLKARKEMSRPQNNEHFAYIGIGIIITLLLIVIPIFFMSIG